MHQIWTVNESCSDCSDSLRNSAGDLTGNALKERRNVVLNTADTADGNASYNTVMCNLVRQLDHSDSNLEILLVHVSKL